MRALMRWGVLAAVTAAMAPGCSSPEETPALKEVRRVHVRDTDVVLLSGTGTLGQGKDAFVVEFRNADGQLVDAGTVTVNATMTMAGMAPMFGESEVHSADAKGRYDVSVDLGMSGSWRFTIAWNGPSGRGSVVVPATVQ